MIFNCRQKKINKSVFQAFYCWWWWGDCAGRPHPASAGSANSADYSEWADRERESEEGGMFRKNRVHGARERLRDRLKGLDAPPRMEMPPLQVAGDIPHVLIYKLLWCCKYEG